MLKRGLGKGLGALLPESAGSPPEAAQEIAIRRIRANADQPRQVFDPERLAELAASIREHGVVQPILVRPLGDGFEIVAGERRWRAAQLAGLRTVPAVVRELTGSQVMEIALIENLQREDLNPLEEAQGVQRLLNEFGLTHEQAAQAIGRSRSATSNLLRLLNLAQPVQTMLLAGDIDMGHARALLAVDAATQIQLANVVIARRLSVRDTEKLVAMSLEEGKAPARAKAERSRDVIRLEEALSDVLGTRVSFKIGAKERGQIVIDFHGWEHLSSLLERQGLGSVLENN